MMDFHTTRIAIADFLNIILYQNSVFILNYWSIVHFISGMIVMYLILHMPKRRLSHPFFLLLSLLILYEGIELGFILSGSALFIGEPLKDVVWDVIFGMLGGFIAKKYF